MNTSEAIDLVDEMRALWPDPDWANPTIDAYIAYVSQLGVEVARGAIERLKLTAKKRPAIAELDEACRRVATDLVPVQTEDPADTEPSAEWHPPTPEEREAGLSAIEGMRETLDPARKQAS